MIKKAEDTEADTAEQSAIKLRAQQQSSNALVLTDQRPVNGTPTSSQLTLVKVPTTSSYPVCFSVFSLFIFQNITIAFFLALEPINGILHLLLWYGLDWNLLSLQTKWQDSADQELSQTNGTLNKVDSSPPAPDLLGDLLGPLAIEGPPSVTAQNPHSKMSEVDGVPNAVEGGAIVPVGEQTNSVQVLFFF